MLRVPLRTAFPLLLAFSIGGCMSDAAHENPLDPESSGFVDAGEIDVRATRFYPPFAGIEGARVRAVPQAGAAANTSAMELNTDPTGRVLFRNVPSGSYALTIAKPGFLTALDTVVVAASRISTSEKRLDGLPVVESPGVSTFHLSRWFPVPQDLFQMDLDVLVSDPDGETDLDRVWLEIPSAGIVDTLLATSTLGRFAKTIPSSGLGNTSLQDLLGTPLLLHVRDKAGQETVSEPVRLVRVIDDTPVALSPQGEQTLADPAPLMTWERSRLPFSFTYRLDVVRVETNLQIPVETISGIPSVQTSLNATGPLDPGNYFWTVSVVDVFGNRSRSKEAGFRIQ